MKEDHKTSRLVLSGLLSLSLATASFPAVALGEQTGVAETSAATAPAASSTTEGASAPSASASTEGGSATGTSPSAATESTGTQEAPTASETPTATSTTPAAPAAPALTMLAVRSPLAATELYVNSATGADTNDGSSAAQAFKTIEKAVAAANANPSVTTIHVQGDFTHQRYAELLG